VQAASYPNGATDLYRLAEAMLQRQKFDDAIAVLEMNATIFPRDVLSLNTLGRSVSEDSHFFEAAEWSAILGSQSKPKLVSR
jgi:hypothetical protein